jgi:hypothetical protein
MLGFPGVNHPTDIFQSLHVLLISEDDARGKALAKALRDQRARVGEVQRNTRDAGGSRGADLIVVDARLPSASSEQLAALRGDVRARWASVISVDYGNVVKADGSVHLASLSELVAPLVEHDRKLTERAKQESNFSTGLAPLGPSRTLRALSLSNHTLLVELRHPTLEASIEVSNELLVSASATRGQKRWDAWSALVRILGLSDAEVSVSRRAFTAVMNIMEPVDQALEVAAQERLCAADQIAVEEAEAQAKQKPAAKMPPPAPLAAKNPPPPPGSNAAVQPAAQPAKPAPDAPEATPVRATLPGPARAPAVPVRGSLPAPSLPARGPGRPAGGLGPQRTLLGLTPGFAGASPAAASAAASATNVVSAASLAAAVVDNDSADTRPTLPPVVVDAPRYAHRAGAGQGPKAASMTLMGVAPGSIPGLAEMRSQMNALRPAPSALADVLIHSKPENSDFDPPTVKHNVAELPDLEDDELLDDLSLSAEPLSTPLPPERATDSDSEPRLEGLSFGDAEDAMDQTTVTPSALTRELLEQAVQDALLERPSLETGGARPIRATRHGVHGMHSKDPGPPDLSGGIVIEGDPEGNSDGAPEETLVVQRPRDKAPASKSRVALGLCVLLGLAGLATFAALREREASEAAHAAAAKPTPSAPAASMPVVAAPKPQPIGPAAVPEAPEPAQPSTAEATEPGAIEPGTAPEPTNAAPAALIAAPGAEAPAAAPATATPTPPAAETPAAAPATTTPAAPTPPVGAESAAPEGAAPSEGSDDSAALLRKGQRLLIQNDAAGARAALEQAMASAQDNPHIRAALTEALLKTGDLEAAQVQAQAAIKLRPKRARYQVLLGDVLKAQGKAPEAQEAWHKALEIDANDAEAKQRLGQPN